MRLAAIFISAIFLCLFCVGNTSFAHRALFPFHQTAVVMSGKTFVFTGSHPYMKPSVDTSVHSAEGAVVRRGDMSPADRMARISRTMGILALGSMGLALLLPVMAAAVVPLGILAITKGSRSRREGSDRPNGKAMGIVALSILLLAVAVVIGIIASPGFF